MPLSTSVVGIVLETDLLRLTGRLSKFVRNYKFFLSVLSYHLTLPYVSTVKSHIIISIYLCAFIWYVKSILCIILYASKHFRLCIRSPVQYVQNSTSLFYGTKQNVTDSHVQRIKTGQTKMFNGF